MTFSTFGSRFVSNGDGVTTVFSFPRLFFANTDLVVALVDAVTGAVAVQTLVTHYTVSGAGTGTGNITMLVPPPVGKKLVRYRATPANQLVDLGNVTVLPMQSLEDQLDRTMVAVDELSTRMSFTMFMPLTYTGTFDFTMPVPVAGYVLAFNDAGTGLTSRAIATQWLQGGGVPAASLGSNGDMYLRTSNNDVYQKIAGAWVVIGNFTGSPGIGSGDVVGPVGAVANRIPTFNGTSGKLIQDGGVTLAQLALLDSPTFINSPVAPTQAPGDNTTKLSTTAFVKAAIDVVIGGATAAGDTLGELETILTGKAPINSPALTGNPVAPTPAPGDNDTSIATTAFVVNALGSYLPLTGGTVALLNIDDANFNLDINAAKPRITFDSTDYLEYDRASNTLSMIIAGGAVFRVDDFFLATLQKVYAFESVNLDPASGVPSFQDNGDLWADTVRFLARIGGADAVNVVIQFLRLVATYVLTSQTAAQKAFNVPANGAFNVVAATTYEFEGFISLSAMSASSGAFGFAFLGTATITGIEWDSVGNKAALATAASPQNTVNVTAANTAVVTATTNTVGWMRIKGIVRINAAGTLIPAVSLGVAAAAVVGVDSFFRISAIANNTDTSFGNVS